MTCQADLRVAESGRRELDPMAVLCHELSQPLCALLGAVRCLSLGLQHARAEDDAVTRRMSEWLAAANESAEHLAALVREARGRLQHESPEPAAFDLVHATDAALCMLEPDLAARARVTRVFGEVPPVPGHRSRIMQVLLNLLANARDVLPLGRSHEHEIEVRVEVRNGHEAVVEVRDTGPGIPRQHLGLVRTPRFSTYRRPDSMGLGLSICDRIVASHSGRLELDSATGRGTVARIVLPLAGTGDRARGSQS